MATTSKIGLTPPPKHSPKEVSSDTKEVEEVSEVTEVSVSATDKLKVLNTSDKKVCLTNGILNPGDEGIATRAELGTLWQFLELAEK